jgi:quinol monooxygenase YgiN
MNGSIVTTPDRFGFGATQRQTFRVLPEHLRRFTMLVVHVHVYVKPEFVDAFSQATIENARNSVQEPGIARFDVIQKHEDPTHFVLVEVYRDSAAPAKHKNTAHYARWRDAVVDMMAEPRSSEKYYTVFPDEAGW